MIMPNKFKRAPEVFQDLVQLLDQHAKRTSAEGGRPHGMLRSSSEIPEQEEPSWVWRDSVTKEMDRILVVDDDAGGAQVTAQVLERAGYAVEVAHSGQDALAVARVAPPGLMVLDYELLDMDAPEVLDVLGGGKARLPFPVIVLTGARLGTGDHVVSLDHGATDHVLKGVDRQVFLAKVRAALRAYVSAGPFRWGPLEIDIDQGRACLDGRDLKLDKKPMRLLYCLAAHRGRVVTREELLSSVWGSGFRGLDHSLEQAIYEIRRALGKVGSIETVRGLGYRLVKID